MLNSSLGTRYVGELDRLFDSYAELTPVVAEHVRRATPKDPSDSDFIYRQAVKAKALDAVRGILPAAAQSNVGIYGTGQAYEALLLRMRASPLIEVRDYADAMLVELRKVEAWRNIPVVVVTAKDITAEDRKRLSGPGVSILQKGAYSRNDLVDQVRWLVADLAGDDAQGTG